MPHLNDEVSALSYLYEKKIITVEDCVFDENCPGEMIQKSKSAKKASDVKMLRCNECHRTRSALHGTFFGKSRIKVNVVLEILWRWARGESHTQVVSGTGCSTSTITDYFNYINELVGDMEDDDTLMIGGEGKTQDLVSAKLGIFLKKTKKQ